jgi:hypothetical protein
LRQGLLAQLGSSASAGRERGQFADLFARHAITSFPNEEEIESGKEERRKKKGEGAEVISFLLSCFPN